MDNKEYTDLIHNAQKQKIQLTTETAKKVQKLYQEVNKDLLDELKTAKGFNKAWLIDYSNVVKKRMYELHDTIYELGVDTANKSSIIVTGVQENFFRKVEQKTALKIPKDVFKGLTSIPEETISNLLNGTLYKDRAGLSKRIWKSTNKMSKDINYVLARGIAEQKPYTEIMKDLDAYTNPKASKPWNWSTVYPGTNKIVDYNSQRLMRTGINHAFFITSTASAQRNPFVDAIHWELSGQHYERQIKPFGPDICDTNAKQNDYHLGTGNFPKDKVPTPHPMCLCSQSSAIHQSLEAIGDELGEWLGGGTNIKLDKWYSSL